MHSKRIILATLVSASLGAVAAPAPLPPDTVLIKDGNLTVDAVDFEANILRIPENRRNEFRASYDRVASVVDQIFTTRALAAKAREAGLDQDPAVQRRLLQIQEGFLADLYSKKLESETVSVDLEARARELYKVDQAKFVYPEHVRLQDILVGFSGRTREMALERANKVYEEARSGKEDFLELAKRYSDDPDVRRNKGDHGFNEVTSYAEPVTKAVASVNVKGTVFGPVESDRGFHILKFIERQPAKPLEYAAVRKKLVDAERDKINKKRYDDVVQAIRESPTVEVHPANVERLVVPVDLSQLKKAAEAPKPR